jgi:hypothetical protein
LPTVSQIVGPGNLAARDAGVGIGKPGVGIDGAELSIGVLAMSSTLSINPLRFRPALTAASVYCRETLSAST